MEIYMNPISNPLFHDYPKYVYQTPDVVPIHGHMPSPKPFSLKPPEKSKKTKKDIAKQDKRDEEKEEKAS